MMDSTISQATSPGIRSLMEDRPRAGMISSASGMQDRLTGYVARFMQGAMQNIESQTPQAVAGRIVDFVQNAIANRATDTDMANDMLLQARQGVAQGIADAREILQTLGQLSKFIDEQIVETESLINEGLDGLQQAPAAIDSADSITEQSRILAEAYQSSRQFSRSQTASIQIMTQDGDSVEISYSSLMQSMSQQVYMNDSQGASFASSRHSSAEVQFEFSVRGELDQAEQQAIDALLKDLGKVASRFFDGNVKAAFNAAMEIGLDTGELKSLSMDLQQTTEIRSLERYQSTEQLSGDPMQNSRQGPRDALDVLSQLQQLLEQARQTTSVEQPENAFKQLLADMLDMMEPSFEPALKSYIKQSLQQL